MPPPPSPSNASGSDSDHHTASTFKFSLKPSGLVTVDRPAHLGLATDSVHDDFASQGSQDLDRQEDHDHRTGQAIVFGQPLEDEGVIPGLGLFLGDQTNASFEKETGSGDSRLPQSLKMDMLDPSLKPQVGHGAQIAMASTSFSHSESNLMGVGVQGGNASVLASIGMAEPGLSQTQKMALLKEARDAALSMYKQKINEVHWYASKVALLDMHYIKALQDNHSS